MSDIAADSRGDRRPDGRLGPDIKVSTADCAPSVRCGIAPFTRNGGFAQRATGQPMSVLARLVSQLLGQAVLDRTGLAGRYDFELAFDMSEFRPPAGILPQGAAFRPSDNPPLAVALTQQLGLRPGEHPHADRDHCD